MKMHVDFGIIMSNIISKFALHEISFNLLLEAAMPKFMDFLNSQ